MRNSKRAVEEIDLYEALLVTLKACWRANGPGQFSDALTEAIEDTETLAHTTCVFDVRIRLLALIHLMFDCGDQNFSEQAWNEVLRTIASMQATPSLKHLYAQADVVNVAK